MSAGSIDDRLCKLISSEEALALLEEIRTDDREPYGVDGFVMHADGGREARLDLILDVSANLKQLTKVERCDLLVMFVANRAAPNIWWEVVAEETADRD